MQDTRPLKFFIASLGLGVVVVFVEIWHIKLLLWVIGLLALAGLMLAAYVIFDSLPRGQRQRAQVGTLPQGLGQGWMVLAGMLAVTLFFTLWSNLDQSLARFFFSEGVGFVGRGWLGQVGRFIGYTVPFVVLAAWVLGWLAERFGVPTPFSPRGRDVLFLTLAMILGPGLVVNLGMKDHLHRPRPAHLAEFGGGSEFRAFYQFDGACKKNCSFPSGEAAEAFWMLAPASLAPAPWRAQAMAGAVVFGVFTSVLRMAYGGHFLSDVVFAALIMWGILLVLKRNLYPPDSTAA